MVAFSRYVPLRSRFAAPWPEADRANDREFAPAMTVFEYSDDPIDTGLLDQHGNPLGRIPERDPIGFAYR